MVTCNAWTKIGGQGKSKASTSLETTPEADHGKDGSTVPKRISRVPVSNPNKQWTASGGEETSNLIDMAKLLTLGHGEETEVKPTSK